MTYAFNCRTRVDAVPVSAHRRPVQLVLWADSGHGGHRSEGAGQGRDFTDSSPPDARSQVHAERRGYDLSDLRARQITDADFTQYDLILVMDWDNLALVQDECPPEHMGKVRRLTEFCLTHDAPVVPDPYHGGAGGFDHVLDLVEDACDGLVRHVKHKIAAA